MRSEIGLIIKLGLFGRIIERKLSSDVRFSESWNVIGSLMDRSSSKSVGI